MEMKPFEFNYRYMSYQDKKSFVHRTVKSNLALSCWRPSVGMDSYREAQSIALRNGKWAKLVFHCNGVHVSSLRSPGWGLSTGDAETSIRLQRWWNWLRKAA